MCLLDMLWYIIHKVQSTNSAAGRELTSKIEGLRLSKEPGFHVDTLLDFGSYNIKNRSSVVSLPAKGASKLR